MGGNGDDIGPEIRAAGTAELDLAIFGQVELESEAAKIHFIAGFLGGMKVGGGAILILRPQVLKYVDGNLNAGGT